MLQINPWEPWAPWPQQPAQQQANQGQQVLWAQQEQAQQLNLNEPPQQPIMGQIDLNLDPMEVIINPVQSENPQMGQGLNLQEVEQLIPQQAALNQVQQFIQPQLEAVDNNNFINGAPLPQLPDLIGEEIHPQQLMDHNAEEGDDNFDMDLDPIVEPEELALPANIEDVPPPPVLMVQEQPQEFQVQDLQGANLVQQHDQPEDQLEVGQQQNPDIQLNQNLQVGMALVPQTPWGPVFHTWEINKNLEDDLQAWDHMISPGNAEPLSIKIPLNWIKFFITVLSSSEHFGWAKSFLQSGAPSFLGEKQGMVSVPLPKQYPDKQHAATLELTAEQSDAGLLAPVVTESQNVAPEASPKQDKGKKKTPAKRAVSVVDTEVRRSERKKEKEGQGGFKSPSCPILNCISCNPPPTVPAKTLRNLGVQFCGMESADASEDKLNKKKGKMDRAVKKKARKDDKQGADLEDKE